MDKKSFSKIFICLIAGLSLFTLGCSKKPSAKKELRVFTWSSYLSPEVITAFETKHQAKVVLDYFSSNEELLAKVKATVDAKGRGYDVIFPSDYMVTTLASLGLLTKLEVSRLGVVDEFEPQFKSPRYDPKLEWSLAFAYGTTGLAVNTKLAPDFDVKKGISWKELFENPKFRGKFTMLDDSKENLHVALLAQGKNWNNANEKDIADAFAWLKKHKDNVKAYTSETRPVIENEECVYCQAYSGDVFQVQVEKPEVVFVIPQEGATLWTDNLSIPVNAKETDLAYAFMQHVLARDAAKEFTKSTFFASPNRAAMSLLTEFMAQHKGLLPAPSEQQRLAFLTERGELLPVIDRHWTEMRSE